MASNRHADHEDTRDRVHTSTRDDLREAIVNLLGQAHRRIVLFAPVMDGYLFNTAHVAQTLARFATGHRQNLARVLVENTHQALHDNERIIELSRRLSDFIKLRKVGERHTGLTEMFIVIDTSAYLHQPDLTKPDCLLDFTGRRRRAELSRKFEQIWDAGEPITGIHPLGI